MNLSADSNCGWHVIQTDLGPLEFMVFAGCISYGWSVSERCPLHVASTGLRRLRTSAAALAEAVFCIQEAAKELTARENTARV